MFDTIRLTHDLIDYLITFDELFYFAIRREDLYKHRTRIVISHIFI